MPIMIWWIIRSTRYCSNWITAIATNLLCCTPVNADVSRRTTTVIEAKSNYKACISPSYMSEPQGLIVYKVVRDSHQHDSLSLHNAMFPRREGAKCYAHHIKYAWHMQDAHSMIPMSGRYQLQLQTLLWSASVAWHDKLFIWPSRYPVVSVNWSKPDSSLKLGCLVLSESAPWSVKCAVRRTSIQISSLLGWPFRLTCFGEVILFPTIRITRMVTRMVKATEACMRPPKSLLFERSCEVEPVAGWERSCYLRSWPNWW